MSPKNLWTRLTKSLLHNSNGEASNRYRILRRNIFILMILITIIPLIIMAGIYQHEYQSSINFEELSDQKTLNRIFKSWFHEVVVKGNYISDVFMGYRQFPHVAIAVLRRTEEGRYLILRATIDTSKFDNIIASMQLDQESDAFLINREGFLQTPSRFYGKILDKYPVSFPRGNYGSYQTAFCSFEAMVYAQK